MIRNQLVFELPEIHAATLDPLHLDAPLSELPKHNNMTDLPWLIDVTNGAVEMAIELDDPNAATATACLRDFDFLAGSLLRHGTDPIQTVPGLEDTMLKMGDAAGTVPRGTVATYAVANPEGYRKRSFTGSPEEELFTESLRKTYTKLEPPTHALGEIDLADPQAYQDLVPTLEAISDGMVTMTESVVAAIRRITPEHFTNVIRPYFEPLTIGGEEYHAPNGGQLQLLPLEAMLWHGGNDTSKWREFLDANHPYLTPAQRISLAGFNERNSGQSVLGHVVETAKNGDTDDAVVAALEGVLRNIRKFRYPHLKITEDNFALRPEGAVGSGSFTLDALRLLLDDTNKHTQTHLNLRG